MFVLDYYHDTAKRPPVEETANFLQTLLANHGPNYLEKLFGRKARDALAPLGGSEKVAVALSGNFVFISYLNLKLLKFPSLFANLKCSSK